MVKSKHALRTRLRSPLDKAAIKQNPDSERSAVNPMYVIERLNDSFGEDGWTADYKAVETNGKMIVVECQLRCWHPWVEPRPEKADIVRRAFGGNDNADRGDAYKGACTDALTKAASHLGIAHQVYKGFHDAKPQAEPEVQKPRRMGVTLNQAQQQNFWGAVRESGKSQEQVDAYLFGRELTAVADILKTDYEQAMEWARRKSEAA